MYLGPTPASSLGFVKVLLGADDKLAGEPGAPAGVNPAGGQSHHPGPALAAAAAVLIPVPAAPAAADPGIVGHPAAEAAAPVPPSVTENTLNQINNSNFALHFLYVHRLGDGSWWCG